ncbi:trifunctional transcriptional regulator/proline dehydrogenase/L-glutamate gamma-semialdehyde dehydrogenase [Paenalcaligenes suwonensis]|uniref:trifunctional transcriptional regulator/proline dehydrogenase/L-glutamate gamma-semialdehyde dehydrogenase n=1 Tax=Paenalcaligenes suwonensis TaxID=1202713 RepID=UPI00140D6FFA|nr:trifunctional transcriptional regulator/proline dehydrogenase/L-glutamate gamma-semialdehyde dehydrogenase [Paenalcaligenes suwonensis]NHC62877.1 trifunctional transcriptional regulator/proline dehydrogenase/L-glutamate gamma-semialdehyde dehydrogenase [Paenalcaligenes suwonensis]
MSATTLGVKVDAELRGRIREAAERIGRTQHWFIKQAIFSFLEEIEAGRLPPSLAYLTQTEGEKGVDLEQAGLSVGDNEPTQPFLEFAQSIAPQSVLRAAITSAYRRAEEDCLPGLISQARSKDQAKVRELARKLVSALRAKGQGSGVDSLIHEFSLSSQEGVALMCLAEALLRIPDRATRDALIRDKVSKGEWQSHLSSGSMFVNAATWGLMLTGKLVSTSSEKGLSSAIGRLISKGGEPLIRKGVDMAMRLMGEHFVCGETISDALANGKKWENKGFSYSYDMLGEAAMTEEDAARYYASYEQAIHAIGKASNGKGIYQGPGISIKLSALHSRYSRAQYDRVMQELLPRVKALTLLARQYDIGLNIDAEEADRLEISLDLLEALCQDPDLAGWNGIGFVIQGYQKRAPYVIDFVIDLGRRTNHRLMVRLVKGAYWDTEVKRAQVDGLEGYPVYTRKIYTDIAYLACAKKLLSAPDAIFPQFATHNALTLAAIYEMAGSSYYLGQYEFQCLHGMGEPLYEEVVGPISQGKLARPCRIYAPVGTHETLLAYLVRRLLENGANSSFVNRIADENVSIDELIRDPIDEAEAISPVGAPHPMIPLPAELFKAQGENRQNSQGLDLSNEHRLASLSAALLASTTHNWHAAPATLAAVDESREQAVLNPADHRDVVGKVIFSSSAEVDSALARSVGAAPIWQSTTEQERARCLLRAADLLEAQQTTMIGLIVREAGKTFANAVAEIREAVDFLRYYANRIEQHFSNDSHRPLGPVVCISPWNFPLAIFLGQVSAALAAGNTVLAKPAEQTGLIAAQGIKLLHEAGIPHDVVQLLPGEGDVGAMLVGDDRVQGVMFTGSTEVAKRIAATLAQRVNMNGQPIPLIAETGGQNALIVDSSALPEQVIADVLNSAFDSAGQRCSALRILCVQEDVADTVVTMLRGAMRELRVGNPDVLYADVGPVIDAEAQGNIRSHIDTMRSRGFDVEQLPLGDACQHGTFVPPTIIRINSIADVEREVFGPVLHVLTYKRAEQDALLKAINDTGYGLTFGVHSRIDETINRLIDQVHAGNVYVNRNIVGAVVGVQPFGGEGLSGTGPKAGGPIYMNRLLSQRPDHLVLGGKAQKAAANEALDSLQQWADSHGDKDLSQSLKKLADVSLFNTRVELPGPTGEANTYSLKGRGAVVCVPATKHGLVLQVATSLASGNEAVIVREGVAAEVVEPVLTQLPEAARKRVVVVDSLKEAMSRRIGGVIFEGDCDALKSLSQFLAEQDGPVLQAQGRTSTELANGQLYRMELLVAERSLSVNTAAAGGNATLMAVV